MVAALRAAGCRSSRWRRARECVRPGGPAGPVAYCGPAHWTLPLDDATREPSAIQLIDSFIETVKLKVTEGKFLIFRDAMIMIY